jgi:hypothetical protein
MKNPGRRILLIRSQIQPPTCNLQRAWGRWWIYVHPVEALFSQALTVFLNLEFGFRTEVQQIAVCGTNKETARVDVGLDAKLKGKVRQHLDQN